MATANEHALLNHPDKQVILTEIPAADSQAAVTFRLLVEQYSDYCLDVDTMEDVACRVPLRDLARQGAVDRAFRDLVAMLDNPMLRPEVALETRKAAARVQARCHAVDELGGVEFRLCVKFYDASQEWASEDEEEDESGSDMEFGEFDLSGRREAESIQDDEAYQRALAGGTPVSRVSRAAMVGQALQSANQQQQSKSPSHIFPMRTGY
ncbi:unnamed protein product [Alopecurus aequalis]